METVLFYSSNDQPIFFPYKSQIGRGRGRIPPKKDMNLSQQSSSTHHFQSFSSSQQQQQQQPPLLPLPLPHTRIPNSNSHPPQVRVRPPLSRSPRQPTTDIQNNHRDDSVTPRKSKPLPTSPKNLKKPTKELPDQVARITSSSSVSGTSDDIKWIEDVVEVNDFSSGSMAFTLSPPPSSLPLPTFSLRPKLGCNVEAVGFDAGATDKLCHLLRLR